MQGVHAKYMQGVHVGCICRVHAKYMQSAHEHMQGACREHM
mgnify:CR=1 FL=1